MDYLYFIPAEVECDIAEDLFKLAHEYGLKTLKDDCEELMTKDIRVQNVFKKIHFAEIYEASRLRKACLLFIVFNIEEVFMTQNIYELNRETLLELYRIKA